MDKNNLAVGDIIVVETGDDKPSVWNGVIVSSEKDGTPVIARFIMNGESCLAEDDLVFGDARIMQNVSEVWRQSIELRTRHMGTVAAIIKKLYALQALKKPGAVRQFMSDLKMYRVDIDWEPN